MKNIIEVKPQGYCGGVLKAILTAKETRQKYPKEKITVLGNLVHNSYVKEALRNMQIETIENKNKTRFELLEEIKEGVVIFTAHGVSQKVKDRALEKGLICVDASCPFVLQTQKIVQDKLNEGFEIFYIGKNRHPEAESIYSTSEHIHLIEKTSDIPQNISKNIFVTNQTTMSIMDIQSIFKEIKNQYPDAQFHDEICNATRVRQQAILDLQKENVEALIVVGDPTSNNTKKLAEIGKLSGIPFVHSIESIEQLDTSLFQDKKVIAITSGASTPTYLTQQILEQLKNPTMKQKIRIEEIL
ncbi:MAG: 4-hydroxy-3-methylbut-2-enyl diphosphate reductase [Bacillota bacterium]|nr:4-hydroxy-3-methylbut-2-enyl diphosphate reductase [Bacillota bacterium]